MNLASSLLTVAWGQLHGENGENVLREHLFALQSHVPCKSERMRGVVENSYCAGF